MDNVDNSLLHQIEVIHNVAPKKNGLVVPVQGRLDRAGMPKKDETSFLRSVSTLKGKGVRDGEKIYVYTPEYALTSKLKLKVHSMAYVELEEGSGIYYYKCLWHDKKQKKDVTFFIPCKMY